MTDTDCIHERVQCHITGLRSFPTEREPDGIILITEADLSNFYIVQIDTVCMKCGDQHTLETDEWEVA